MKKTIILFTFLLQISCAYYNTFYNAKKYYNKGREDAEKNISTLISNSEIKNYNLTVEKCESVLVKFPNSRYVDDALLLMSKAQFYLGDYQKSKINLEELVRRFPESNLKDEALLWTGRAVWKLGQFTLAESGITEVLNSTDDRKLLSAGNDMLAEIYRDRNDAENEIKYLRDVIVYSDDNQQKAETYYRIGLILIEQNKFKEAISSFQKVEIQLPTPELLIKAKMENTRALKHMGNTTEALDILQAMLDSRRFKNIWGDIELEIAEIAALTGDVDGAIEQYGAIAITYPKSEVAMDAWLKLAKLHTFPLDNDNKYINYPYGMEYFHRAEKELKKGSYSENSKRNRIKIKGFLQSSDNVDKDKIELIWLSGDEDTASEQWHQFTLSQNERLDGILPARKLKQKKKTQNEIEEEEERNLEEKRLLNQQLFAEQTGFDEKENLPIAKINTENDSLALKNLGNVNIDSTTSDSAIQTELNVVDKKKESPFKNRSKAAVIIELIHNEYLMAEFYQLDLNQPDSARTIYEHILTEYPDSEFAPRSALSLGILQMKTNQTFADSMFNLILTKYPDSPSTIEVNRRLNTLSSRANFRANPESILYEQAYDKAFISKNDKDALKLVALIESNYPGSYIAAKAAYLRAYMIDSSNESPENSLKEYNRVIENYSESEFARESRIRVARLNLIIEKPEENIKDEDQPRNKSSKKSKQIITK